jgi:hypothetical protein
MDGLSSWYTTTSNSPQSPKYYNGAQDSHNVISPSNSDGNHYQSPLISPGDWNVVSPSPYITASPHTNVSFQGSPMSDGSEDIRSSPPSTPPPSSFEPPALPTRLGNQGRNRMDQEREKTASRRVQPLMAEATRKKSRKAAENKIKSKNYHLSLKEAKSYLLQDGKEYLASSSKKDMKPIITEDLEGSVNDFKNEFDIEREWEARKHALRIVARNNRKFC